MNDLEIEYKRDTGLVPKTVGIVCPDCECDIIGEDLYTADYVKWLENKIKSYENN